MNWLESNQEIALLLGAVLHHNPKANFLKLKEYANLEWKAQTTVKTFKDILIIQEMTFHCVLNVFWSIKM